ncbi:hypothetical protein MKW92_001871 [Papaver armeniacum]|nr:hypothetical protein MKW92_001871 [Papaver armeniacum]
MLSLEQHEVGSQRRTLSEIPSFVLSPWPLTKRGRSIVETLQVSTGRRITAHDHFAKWAESTTHRRTQNHDVSNVLVTHSGQTTTTPDGGNKVQRVTNEAIANRILTNIEAPGASICDQLCTMLWANRTINRSMAETILIVPTFNTTAITATDMITQMVEAELWEEELTSEITSSKPTNTEENQSLVPQRVDNCHWRHARGHDKYAHSYGKTWHETLPYHYESEDPIPTRKDTRAIIAETDDEAHKLPKLKREAITHP